MIETKDIKITKSVKSLLKSAEELFWKHGIRRITVEEICENAEVSKMTFYRSFSNKFDLAFMILEKKFDKNIALYDKIMSSEVSYHEKITRILELKKSESGNISMELIKDIYNDDEDYKELRAFVDKFQKSFLLKLRSDFEKAQKEGHLRKDLKVDFIIYLLNNLQQLLSDKQLQNMFHSTEELAMNLTKSFFYGIVENSSQS